ncbi:hypothetical protein SEA_MUFASA8_86 [Arthrobacter phage Mufasa8]|uniref:Uncharacterized protein n=1 Tax=Arthrobacter phage Mufasa8 TaxID=2656526 RepID=A0A649VMX7_9CAUD|nr:hypothetical protein HYQ08_gp086 [Arthrobacter phage Mufasa8]QGJ93534.1 hypothetical protein SEA_MUFASA8_86 [Arthrobacter phage Mufasa8]
MTQYLLMAETDHDPSIPVLVTDDLDKAKAAAEPHTNKTNYPPDEYVIYRCEPDTEPVPILSAWVRTTYTHGVGSKPELQAWSVVK